MKTTLTQKLDNYIEKTHGMITILIAIGVLVGGLFALSLASDYGVSTASAFGLVIFLVGFGVVLGALGGWIIAEKNGETNTANTARALHRYYKNELEKLQNEVSELEHEIGENARQNTKKEQDYKDLLQRYQTVKYYLMQNDIEGYAKMQ